MSVMVAFVVAALNIAAVHAWRRNRDVARKLDGAATLARRSRKSVPAKARRQSAGTVPPARATAA
jgi:hypothetical protein